MHSDRVSPEPIDFRALQWRKMLQALLLAYLLASLTAAALTAGYLWFALLFGSEAVEGAALRPLFAITGIGALRFLLPFALVLGPLAIALMLLLRPSMPIALSLGAAFGFVVGLPAVYWGLPAPGLQAAMFAAALPSGAIFVWPLWRAIHRPQEPLVPRSVWVCVAALLLVLAVSPVLAAEPPQCTDEGVRHHLRQAYEVSQMIDGSKLRWKEAEDVRETGLRAAPPSLNQIAPSPDHFAMSRFCEARIVFEDGTSDSAYFRIDGRKDSEAADFNFDPCFLRYDLAKNGCADQRAPVEPAQISTGQPQ